MNPEAKLEELHESACVLYDDITHLEALLDTLTPDTPEALSKERVLNVKWRLYSDIRNQIDALEERLAIESARSFARTLQAFTQLDLY